LMTDIVCLSLQNSVNEFQIIQSLAIIATLSMLALSHRKPESTGTFHVTSGVRIAIKRDTL
jgi:hypothetical protein